MRKLFVVGLLVIVLTGCANGRNDTMVSLEDYNDQARDMQAALNELGSEIENKNELLETYREALGVANGRITNLNEQILIAHEFARTLDPGLREPVMRLETESTVQIRE